MPARRIDSDPVIGDLADIDVESGADAGRPTRVIDLEYAGFWIRLGATLIDTALLMIITVPLLVSIYGWRYYGDGRLIDGPADFLISWVAPAIATILFWRYKEATPGKIILSLRIVDAETGATPSIGQAIGRYFAYFLSMLALCLGFIWIVVDRRRQGWHDKLAGTVVVRTKDRAPEPVRFGGDAILPADHAIESSRARRLHKGWIVVAALAVGLSLVVGWVIAVPEVRWIPYRTGLLTEYRLMQVPMHQQYPPATVCVGGYLVHVNVQARTTYQVKDGHGRRVPCLP